MAEPKTNELMEKIVSLCKRRGFIFQSSEIYGGINGFWDYGPLGAELKRNVRNLWWRSMTQDREDVVGLDASIIMHPAVWKASGHVDTFADPMVDCKGCRKRFRADQIEPRSGTVYRFAGAEDRSLSNAILGELTADGPQQESSARREVAELFRRANHADALREELEKLLASPLPELKELASELHMRLERSERCTEHFAVLLPDGKPPDKAAYLAEAFYRSRGIANPWFFGVRHEPVQDCVQYCNECGSLLTEPRLFNLMLKTFVGPVESDDNVAYLRPETAQAIFAQFPNVLACARQKVPFGICQVGKAFRNEINPRNYTFRSREFEQMELEFFIKPDEVVQQIAGTVAPYAEGVGLDAPQANWGWEMWHRHWVAARLKWYESIGLGRERLELYWQKKEELAHYAKACVDIQYKFPFGTQELEGIAARGDFDLTQHQKHSGKSMLYFDEEAKRKYVPHVIEPSAGVDRLVLALICNAYSEDQVPDEKGKMETRVVMRFHPRVAPIKVGVFPLLKNKPELVRKAREVSNLLKPHLTVFYDEAGAIGRRYRRQDEAGTPFGVTIDFDTLGENPGLLGTVTLRDRDSTKQERVKIEQLLPFLLEKTR